MQMLKFSHTAKRRLSGKKQNAIIGVVASGNLEVLLCLLYTSPSPRDCS